MKNVNYGCLWVVRLWINLFNLLCTFLNFHIFSKYHVLFWQSRRITQNVKKNKAMCRGTSEDWTYSFIFAPSWNHTNKESKGVKIL